MRFFTKWIFIFLLFVQNVWSQENISTNDFSVIAKRFEELKNKNPNVDFELAFKEQTEPVDTCANCPSFLNLTNSVNKVLANYAKDPRFEDEELPTQVKKLKMIYYVVKKHHENGEVSCHKVTNGLDLFDRDTKMEGQAKLIAEQGFSIPNIENMLINNPVNEQIVYYFRDPNQKNVLVQVVSEKNKPVIMRYFSYHPTEHELNPYNLPDLGYTPPKKNKLGKGFDKADINDSPSATIEQNKKPSIDHLNANFDPQIIKRGILPRNVKIGDAEMAKELADDLVVQGNSKLTALNGNEATLKLNSSTRDYLVVDLHTKIDGKTEHKITVPYQIDIGNVFDSDTKIQGAVEQTPHAQSVFMSLTDKNIEVVRATVRANKDNGKNSVLIARDVNLAENGTVTMNLGKDEENHTFAGIRHARNLNKSTSMAVELKLDNQHRKSLYYTLSSQF